MRKIFWGLVLTVLLQSNLYAEKKPQLTSQYPFYSVDEWIVQVKNYYNQSSLTKIGKSSVSLQEAENIALNLCKDDKSFNTNKPEGCLIYSKKETYQNSWRYFMGAKSPEPTESVEWYGSVINYEARIREKNEEQLVKQEQENKRKLEAELKRKKDLERVAILEKDFAKSCRSHSKGSEQYNNCLLEQERIAKEAEAKKLAAKQDQERKKLEVDLAKKRDLEAKAKEEQIKVSKMTPDDRRAYTCSEKFGFRKGSDKFKDCVFKIYQAEIELEKLELQRELAKANAETARVRAEAARASEERQQSLARAQTEAATMQALAARQQAIAANTASSLQMIESGLRMMSPQQSAPRLQTNCFYHARSFSCF